MTWPTTIRLKSLLAVSALSLTACAVELSCMRVHQPTADVLQQLSLLFAAMQCSRRLDWYDRTVN